MVGQAAYFPNSQFALTMKVVMKKNSGFTLVELMIVAVIMIILSLAMINGLDPISLANKARDARRKKDIGRIKVAFEEYLSDRGCYPTQDLVEGLDCNSNEFAPWLSSWPCDPTGVNYRIMVNAGGCPKWFKVLTNLENKKDKDIPSGWYEAPVGTILYLGDGTVGRSEVNYGGSSTNVRWDEETVADYCYAHTGQCYTSPGAGSCQVLGRGVQYSNAFVSSDCLSECRVSCCYNGEVCN